METRIKMDEIIQRQREYFQSGITLDINFRKEMLSKLYKTIKDYEDEICTSLKKDLNKSFDESYMCEIGLCLSEITYMLKHIKSFAKKQRVLSPLAQFPSSSYTLKVPYGTVLIIAPWNYPFLLAIEPLIDAIAAGNVCIIKPSEYAPETAKTIEKMLSSCFEDKYVKVINGDHNVSKSLLNYKYDFIFYTGGESVGKEVLKKAALNLTPAVLELGGKSPCIIDTDVNLKLAAKRIIFGKFLNAGQTCVAPDYILCPRALKNDLKKELIIQIKKQYNDALNDETYVRIINNKHFIRLLALINKDKVIYGSKYDSDKLKIEPTILDDVSFDDTVMKEEIFGPILPIVYYDEYADIFKILTDKPHPLALYIFSNNKLHIAEISKRINYGGGCINYTIIHLASNNLPFGGVGNSGIGNYHGKYGFDAFSHTKAIVDKKTWLDLPMRYHPYKKNNAKLVRIFLK